MKTKPQWVRKFLTLRVRGQLIVVFAVCVLAGLLVTALALQLLATQMQDQSTAQIKYESQLADLASQLEQLNRSDDQKAVQTLLNKFSHYGEGKRLEVLVVDLQGQVIAQSENMTEREINVFDIIDQAMKQVQSEYQEGGPDVRLLPVQTLGTKGYLLVRGYPQTRVNYVKYWNALGALCFFVTFFSLFYFLTRGRIRYLEELANGVLLIAKGNLDHRVPEKSRDELGTLAKNINLMAAELQVKIEEERRTEQLKNELITNVSHDLRTPITSIMGYLRLLRDHKEAALSQWEEYVRIAYYKSEQLQSLMEDLFEYTKLADREVRLEKAKICVNDLLEQLTEEFVPLAERNRLAFDLSLPAERIYLEVDPDKIVRVLENLLGNAVKYSEKPGDIRVGLSREDDGVLIRIFNRSEAISADELPRLFERFYRVDKSRSQHGEGGTGLGLAISKNIVELHSGRIWAESAGEDIVFSLWLPET